jgi:hypothetical protein
MAEEDVGAQLEEAGAAHKEQAGQADATQGEGNQPEGTGYAPPNPGQGEEAESEIPVGVDALDPEKVEQASTGDDDDGGALDVSALASDGGDDAPAEAQSDPDEGGEEA